MAGSKVLRKGPATCFKTNAPLRIDCSLNAFPSLWSDTPENLVLLLTCDFTAEYVRVNASYRT